MVKLIPSPPYLLTDLKDAEKERVIKDYISYFAIRTQQMFEYKNLPDTIPAWAVEYYLQFGGSVSILKDGDNFFALQGKLGGKVDAYYMPTRSVIANPALELNGTYKIYAPDALSPKENDPYDGECVVIRNDSYYIGLLPMFSKYATMLAENDISIALTDINARIQSIITAGTNKSYKAALKYLDDVKNGKLGIISNSAYMDDIKTAPYSDAGLINSLKALIELEQYLKASFWNELGLRDNYNMKREAINGEEAALNDDILLPLADNMLKCRKEDWAKVNELFGLNVEVDFSSAWKDRQIDRNIDVLQIEENSISGASELEEAVLENTLLEVAESAGIENPEELSTEKEEPEIENNEDNADENENETDTTD